MDQKTFPFDPRVKRNSRLRRGIYLLPSVFTVANLLCGYYAVLATQLGNATDTLPFDHAAKAIGFAFLFDSLDGRVARLTGTNTEFGKQFDSIADVLSFGIAPAVLAYAWGVRYISGQGTPLYQQVSQLGWVCCLFFLICCAWRLARFNVKGMAPGGSKYFVGMPTPAAAGMIAAVGDAFHRAGPLQDWRWAGGWLFVAAALGGLMVSTIRYYSFKDLPWSRKQPAFLILFLIILGALIWAFSEVVLVTFAGTYAVAGVILHLVRFIRQRMVSRTA